MAAASTELCFGQRFCGPPGAVNGGFACGSIAAVLGGAVEVTLRRPVPLERPVAVRRDGDRAVAVLDDGMVLAEAHPAAAGAELAAPAVSPRVAREVAGRARYYADQVFPGCFVCGMDRGPGDGLRIFPGPVPGQALLAAPWTPDASVSGADGRVRPEVVWAALDCPGGLASAEAADLPGDTTIVLGRMTASLAMLPRAGQACRVVAWPVAREGRKLTAASALLGPSGEVLAAARTLWLTVRRPVPTPTSTGAP